MAALMKFVGETLDKKKATWDFVPPEECIFRLCTVSLTPKSQKGNSFVTVKSGDEDAVICCLNLEKSASAAFELTFEGGAPLRFSLSGNGPVSLAGYVQMMDDDMSHLISDEDDSVDEEYNVVASEEDDEDQEEAMVDAEEEAQDAAEETEEAGADILKTRTVDLMAETPTPKENKKKRKKNKKEKKEAATPAPVEIEVATPPAKKAKKDAPAVSTAKKWIKNRSGLQVYDLKEGSGEAVANGRTLSMRYVGMLTKNSKQFDKNVKGAPFQFRLGAGEVIKGWDEGLQGMKVGGRRKIKVPAKMGYGKQGSPPEIPKNADLTFTVEVLGMQ